MDSIFMYRNICEILKGLLNIQTQIQKKKLQLQLEKKEENCRRNDSY